MLNRSSRSEEQGFTVVELAVTLVILGIIAVIVYPLLVHEGDKMGPKEFTRSKMRRIEGHILDFYSDKHSWPEPKTWLEQLRPHMIQDRTFSPEDLVLDAWRRRISYDTKSINGHLQAYLYSFGPDGVDDHGTNDDIVVEVYRPTGSP